MTFLTKFKSYCIIFSLFLFLWIDVKANVKPNSLFTDNGVLQQGVVIPVWGTADEGEKVTVEFAGQTVSSIAKNGKWLIKLQPLKASSLPQIMIVKGNNKISISNILIGEVWLCSGQSNMAFALRAVKAIDNYPSVEEVLKDAENYPLIRQFSIPIKKSITIPSPVEDVNGKWDVCNATNAKSFSAVAYFFGRALFKKLNQPIGLINSSYGGTVIENWVSKETLEAYPELKSIITNYEKSVHQFSIKLEEYQKIPLPVKPTEPMNPAERGGPTGLFNTMISPLIPYAMKGCVWYQGEGNASRGIQYRTLLPALINHWRTQWGIGDFPFLIVQIPGWKAHQPELREAQLLTSKNVKNTAMSVITDCDDSLDIHPGNKQPVGERIALQARALAYGEKIEYAGPVYKSMQVQGDKVILSFTHVGTGLMVKGNELHDFVITADNKKFVPAKAEIIGDKVIVFAEGIKNPTAVRLGWRVSPQVNLYNKEGLCATAFKTDIL